MQRQTEKATALYYRAAQKNTDSLNLDNQMQKLLCYASKQELDGFTLYADVGKSGITLDRPALNALKADIEAGRIGKLIVFNISRIARTYILFGEFIEWAQARGVEIISVTDGVLTGLSYSDVSGSLLTGGGQT